MDGWVGWWVDGWMGGAGDRQGDTWVVGPWGPCDRMGGKTMRCGWWDHVVHKTS